MKKGIGLRPTVHDVAAAAGVSLATVDRALNGRGGVRAETRARVAEAVRRLGFARDLSAANLARRRRSRFAFLLPDGANPFIRRLEAEILKLRPQLAPERIEIETIRLPPFDATALAQAVRRLPREDLAGVAVAATDSLETMAALAPLAEEEIPVVALVSALPGFAGARYVGVDNLAAGRTAASLLGRFLGSSAEGEVILAAGSLGLRDHAERRQGFEQVMAAEFPNLELLPPVEGRDEDEPTRAAVANLLARRPRAVGVYNLGAGEGGLIRALRDHAAAGGSPILAVAHELSDSARAALRDGILAAAIHQDPAREALAATTLLRAAAQGVEPPAEAGRIPIEIYLRDNLP